jgi:alkyl sulfatase BDS1-like metallo-beta-lactamase superfamily hydrolase
MTDTTISDPRITQYYSDSLEIKKGNLTIKLWHTSGETPDHSLILIPELAAVFVGDNYYSSFPNLYTLRGTRPRWALDYVHALDLALSHDPAVLLPGHGSWLSGRDQISYYAGGYRNAIRYVHDETVRGMNAGKDRFALMREIHLPEEYSFIGQTYGTVQWSVRGIYEGYAGWFDENPSSMYSLPFSSVSEDVINLTGIDSALDLVRSYIGKKDYVRGLHLTEIILNANPDLQEAIDLRRTILIGLKLNCRNYIENIWLNYAISQCSGNN